MKRTIAILLLAIHLFNLVGYRTVLSFLQTNNLRQTETLIDKGLYNESELVTVKVHYPLPYATNWSEYEQCDGSIAINGMQYNYVRRKLANDTLYLMCLPNYEQTKLITAKNELNKSLAESTSLAAKQKGKPIGKAIQKGLCVEYRQVQEVYVFSNVSIVILQKFVTTSCCLHYCFRATPYQPPRETA